jgi:drug/metabolite transporter (DMT)-like permease
MKTLHGHGVPIAFVAVWSSGYIGGAIATESIAPLAVTLWRLVVASLLLGIVAWRRQERWPQGRSEIVGAITTGILLFALQFGALYMALAAGMPAATTALIACSSPLAVASLSAALRWERMSGRQWFGVLLGVLGVVITLADRLGRPPSVAALLWALLGLIGLVSGTMLQGRLLIPAGPASLASVELAASSLILALCAPLAGSLAIPETFRAIASFAWVAVVAGVGAPLLLFALIRKRGATQASSLLFVVPGITALGAWPILGTPIGPTALIGFAVAAFGLRLARASHRAQAGEHAADRPWRPGWGVRLQSHARHRSRTTAWSMRS